MIPLLGLELKKPETLISKNICTHLFISVSLTIAKIWKQPKCPSVGEWMKEQWCIYTMGYCKAVKKKRKSYFVTAWMYLEIIMLRGIRESVKDKYCKILLICGI